VFLNLPLKSLLILLEDPDDIFESILLLDLIAHLDDILLDFLLVEAVLILVELDFLLDFFLIL
jgi:hypothetical protein